AEIETLRKQAAAVQALADEAATTFETEISNLKADIETKDAGIADKARELASKTSEITARDSQIATLETRIRTLSDQVRTLESNATRDLPTTNDNGIATTTDVEGAKASADGTPRDRVSVELALLSAPGLSR